MLRKISTVVCLFAALLSLAACRADKDGSYRGFDNLSQYETPQDALDDGCFVVVSENDTGTLYGGLAHWEQFLADCEDGSDAFLRVIHFIDGKPYAQDLLRLDGQYHYYDAESENLPLAPFKYLRRLTGVPNNTNRERSLYVLTDSTELTFEQVQKSFFSGSFGEINALPPFRWLGFTTYLPEG